MTFNDLNLNNPLRNALADLGYEHPTTIQHKAFSIAMSGRDVVGIAQTGTGKTFAYLLPCLRLWKFSKQKNPQTLIVVPTRELVAQVVVEAEKLTKYMNAAVVGAYGGTNIKTQIAAIHEGADILVATPGRLLDLALTGVLKLKGIKHLIIDEVDEMLDLGFRPQLIRVLDLLPEKRQNLLFSATITNEVEQLMDDFFNFPEKIEAAPTGTPLENIEQQVYEIPNFYTKVNLLNHLLSSDETMNKVLVFTASKRLANQLYEEIEEKYLEQIGVIHSNKAQNNRFNTVNSFKDGTYRLIIATDIIARGLDVSEVSHVINFDIPAVAENYMHRIGRTGRADKKGIAISFVREQEKELQHSIETLMKFEIPKKEIPEAVEISDILTEDEKPKINMKTIQLQTDVDVERGSAFQEKKAKNKKVNNKIRYADLMKAKYKKPKSRGKKVRSKKRKR